MPMTWSESGELLTTGVGSCARCGEDHVSLPVKRFGLPIDSNGRLFEYWAMCPISFDPILVAVLTDLDFEETL